MKVFICLVLIAICNVAVNQAAAIDIQEESALQFEPTYYEGQAYDAIDEHSRPRRQTSNGQAGVDIKQQGRTTSVNAQAGRVWQSNDGRTRVEANVNYGRDYGRGGSRPNYGGNVGISHRW
ncbi:uncharacterized protein LOC129569789 [Sitodiplosis mosellana]|uniref:uncharacterized protein LOC129569789 n=1 Tax=Sitodiplosis mosellana TaxID=263140 RepID=UPI0024445097|nr:uncharacterized protein LOC129569789 [Sitodiplosis mosellana]